MCDSQIIYTKALNFQEKKTEKKSSRTRKRGPFKENLVTENAYEAT